MSDTNLVIAMLLVRIYDVQMAMLREINPAAAIELYELHNEGQNNNPHLWVPEIKEEES